jgi:hypothetical protein
MTDKDNESIEWREQCLKLRKEDPDGYFPDKAAEKWLADELRALADHIDGSGKYPRVMDCMIPKEGVAYKGGTAMRTWMVTLSYPWGG